MVIKVEALRISEVQCRCVRVEKCLHCNSKGCHPASTFNPTSAAQTLWLCLQDHSSGAFFKELLKMEYLKLPEQKRIKNSRVQKVCLKCQHLITPKGHLGAKASNKQSGEGMSWIKDIRVSMGVTATLRHKEGNLQHFSHILH